MESDCARISLPSLENWEMFRRGQAEVSEISSISAGNVTAVSAVSAVLAALLIAVGAIDNGVDAQVER